MMTLDRWIASIFLVICMIYGYTAWVTMDVGLPPFMQRNPVWPSTFPKILSILGIGCAIWVLVSSKETPIKEDDIDYDSDSEGFEFPQEGGDSDDGEEGEDGEDDEAGDNSEGESEENQEPLTSYDKRKSRKQEEISQIEADLMGAKSWELRGGDCCGQRREHSP